MCLVVVLIWQAAAECTGSHAVAMWHPRLPHIAWQSYHPECMRLPGSTLVVVDSIRCDHARGCLLAGPSLEAHKRPFRPTRSTSSQTRGCASSAATGASLAPRTSCSRPYSPHADPPTSARRIQTALTLLTWPVAQLPPLWSMLQPTAAPAARSMCTCTTEGTRTWSSTAP